MDSQQDGYGPGRRRRALRAAAALALGLLIAATGLEVAARVTDARQAQDTLPERVNWALRERNGAGFHDLERTLEKPAGVWRLVVLGDSFTMGEWVPREELFVTRLEGALNARPEAPQVELVNLALGGMDTTQEVALLRQRGLAYGPDAVLVVFFVNDATGLDANPTVVRRIHEQLEQRHSALGRWSRAWDRFDQWRLRRRVTREMLRDYRDSFFGNEEQRRHWAGCQKALVDLKRLALERGLEVWVAIFPLLLDLGADHPLRDVYREVEATCSGLGLPCLDLFPVFEGRDAESLWVAPRDSHPNALANELVVPALAEFVVDAGLVPAPR